MSLADYVLDTWESSIFSLFARRMRNGLDQDGIVPICFQPTNVALEVEFQFFQAACTLCFQAPMAQLIEH